MSVTWILVANARNARVFSQSGPNKALELVKESEAENTAHEPPRVDPGRASPKHDEQPSRIAAREFAQQLASELNSARVRGSFNRAILVAPPGFMGLLNAELDAPTAALISDRLDKDYTKEDAQQLGAHLGQCICI